MKEKKTRGSLLKISCLLCDFDGVLTDNRVWITQDGSESVCCNRGDGQGFNLLRAAGIYCIIISTEINPVVRHRARKLGLPVLQGLKDKGVAVKKICADRGLDPRYVAFVGNDLNDLPGMTLVGIRFCPRDAAIEIRRISTHILQAKGGAGVVREIAAGLGSRWVAWS